MLKLNSVNTPAVTVAVQHLNTSHVKAKHNFYHSLILQLLHLNTSHVKAKPT